MTNTPTPTAGAFHFDADHVLHHFSSIGYEVAIAYNPDDDGWYTFNAGMVAPENRNQRRHESQAHAIAFAANQVLEDVDRELENLEIPANRGPRLEVLRYAGEALR